MKSCGPLKPTVKVLPSSKRRRASAPASRAIAEAARKRFCSADALTVKSFSLAGKAAFSEMAEGAALKRDDAAIAAEEQRRRHICKRPSNPRHRDARFGRPRFKCGSLL